MSNSLTANRFEWQPIVCMLMTIVFVQSITTNSFAQPPAIPRPPAVRQWPAIYVMNADGSDLHRLMEVDGFRWHGWPQWSPDGKFILFDAHPDNAPSNNQSHIFKLLIGQEPELTDLGLGRMPSWSPDSKQVVFFVMERNSEGAKPGVWRENADGTGREFLFEGREACFSPDGTRISFVDDSLYVYDIKAQTKIDILKEKPTTFYGAAWSPDGKRLAFIQSVKDGARQLVLIASDGSGKPKVRATGDFTMFLNWAPGPKILLGVKGQDLVQRLCTVDPDAEDPPERLKYEDAGTLNVNPSWSPDSKQIIFTSDRPQQ